LDGMPFGPLAFEGPVFPAKIPMADRRSRFAVAPARWPLPIDHHRLVRLRRIPHASPAGPSCGREMGP
jgi:hypothetical protein